VVIAPWLCGDDHKRISKLKGKYMFGHFELPGYLMNAMVEMPDHGEVKREDFNNFEHVFSGHFHKRQTKKNITYIGNCFPHNYADAGDDERGVMILEWGKEPEFHAWPEQPLYRVYNLSNVLDRPDQLLKLNMHARINLDIDISYEEASFIKEKFMADYDIRELTLIPEKKEVEMNTNIDIQAFESVDQIVSNQLVNIQSDTYDTKVLLSIYNSL
jgi:hypothetical protein